MQVFQYSVIVKNTGATPNGHTGECASWWCISFTHRWTNRVECLFFCGYFLPCDAKRSVQVSQQRPQTAASAKFPTWLWYDLQLKLDLWPARNHCIDVGVFLRDSFDAEGMPVSGSRDGVFVTADDVLQVALPFYFGVGLLCLRFKDHRRPRGCFLGLWFLGKCWNYTLRLCLKTTRCSLP